MYQKIKRKLEHGQTIMLDGGTGTDLQARGAPMSGETWCAEVNLTHPEIVASVHHDYIAAGADIITCNSFATSPLLFNARGRDDDLLVIDQAAVKIARQVVIGRDVAVAGSISTMRPVVAGTDRTSKDQSWRADAARALYDAKVTNLKAAGVDLLMMEMMRDSDYSVIATEAALASGLPVWVGISVERDRQGQLTGFGREDQPFRQVAEKLSSLAPDVMSIMHSSVSDTAEALTILRDYWSGPLGAYPESGYFKSPDWQFVDVISPEDLLAHSLIWRELGVSIFGGCCGIGPEHIRSLSAALR